MGEQTQIPLRVKYIDKDSELIEPFEKGMLYFVEAQNTIYKDGIVPFGGINNVTFVETGQVTEIRFNNDNQTDGNAGKIVVANENLVDIVKGIYNRLVVAEQGIDKLLNTTSVVYNLDTLNPKDTPYTLHEAINYILTSGNTPSTNAAILFNNGYTTKMYFFVSTDHNRFGNLDCWKEVQIDSNDTIQSYPNRSSFPVVGQPNILYIDKESNETFYWDDNSLVYKQCGFDPLNINFIDSNFK